MATTPAQKKLREAAFFLTQLERESTSLAQNHSEAGDFFMSAFLSAARSVTFALEAAAPDIYPAWSTNWRSSRTEEERRLLATFTKARNRALKRETPNVEPGWSALQREQHPFSALPVEYFFFFEGAPPITEGATIFGRLTPESGKQELLPVCRQYLRLLEELVKAFPGAASDDAAA